MISDPSASFVSGEVHGHAVEYVRPAADGALPFDAGTFDLILCLGVLHHIPNVSAVLGELRRVLRRDGYALIREPIVSMGDWRQPRRGLTQNERGIPLQIFRRMVRDAGFLVRRETLCVFPPLTRLAARTKVRPFDCRAWVRLDRVCCALSARNYRYHTTRLAHKFAPSSCFFVLTVQE